MRPSIRASSRRRGWALAVGGLGAVVVTLAGQAPAAPQGLRLLQGEAVVPSGVGPQRGVTCPAGAVDLAPGTDLQRAVDARPVRTTFCFKAGVYPITSAITPKTGDTFVGEFGAILDGSGWTTTDSTQAAFRAHNQDIDDVTIRNLVIRNMPRRGIHAFKDFSDRWTIESNEIAGGHDGILVPNGFTVRRNYIHHNVGNASSPNPADRGGGYQGNQSVSGLFDGNEIANNGPEQKVTLTSGVTFRDNFVHHNLGDGIWYDGDNVGALVEGNRVEDNPGAGILYEISGRGVIRNNIVRRSGDNGVFISTSRDVEIYGNALEDNFRGINYFVNCAAVGRGAIGWDLINDNAHDNAVKVGARSGSIASGLSASSDCTPAQLAPYLNDAKGLQFLGNRYQVPSTSGQYWFWGPGNLKTFSDWQLLGRDRQGSVSQ